MSLSEKQRKALAYIDRAGVPRTMENIEQAQKIIGNIMGQNKRISKECDHRDVEKAITRAAVGYSMFEKALLERTPAEWYNKVRVSWRGESTSPERNAGVPREQEIREDALLKADRLQIGTEITEYDALTRAEQEAVSMIYSILRKACREMR